MSGATVPRVPKAANILADDLRHRVLSQRLPVGAEMPSEGALIEETGFSRGVVREALRLLEADGLIAIKRGPRGGVTVAHPQTRHITHSLALLLALSGAPLRDLFAFRLLLEPAAAAIAAQAATDEQREQLLAMAHFEDADGAVPHNVDFHILLAEATNNEFHRVTLSAIHELTRWHSVNEGLDDADLHAAATGHHRIASHIASGDSQRAERAMRKHIEAFEQIMAAQGRLDSPVIRGADWNRTVR